MPFEGVFTEAYKGTRKHNVKFRPIGYTTSQCGQSIFPKVNYKVKVAVIQESKLTLNSRTPNIQNFTKVRNDRDQCQGGGLLTLIHISINFSRRPDTLAASHLEELSITTSGSLF